MERCFRERETETETETETERERERAYCERQRILEKYRERESGWEKESLW